MTAATSRGLRAAGVGFLWFALGCHAGPVRAPPNPPTAETLLAHLTEHQRALRTRKGEARIEYWDHANGERIKATLLYWAARGGRLRLDLDSQIGPLATLATDGQSLALLDARSDRFFVGRAEPCAVAKLIRIAMAPAYVSDVLLGDVPLIRHERARVDWDGQARRWNLILDLPGGETERLEFAEGSSLLAAAELRTATGKRQFRIEHDDYAPVQGIPVPNVSRFVQDGGHDVTLKVRSQEINANPPEAAWTLKAAPGVTVEELLCGDVP